MHIPLNTMPPFTQELRRSFKNEEYKSPPQTRKEAKRAATHNFPSHLPCTRQGFSNQRHNSSSGRM
jgi:hypothetical protein